MNVIEMNDVWKSFRLGGGGAITLSSFIPFVRKARKQSVQALCGVNLTVKRGEKVGVIGTNGSGKTSLMRVVAGIYTPDRGTVQVRGRVASLLQLGIGTIGRLTVTENIYLYGAVMGLSRAEIRSRYDEILAFSELSEFAQARVGQLSTGMNQRLTFSVAIQADADILLLDEVLAVGDQQFKNKCYDYFRRRLTADKAMLFCSHNLVEIEEFCPTTIWIEKGRIRGHGPTEEVIGRYKEAIGYPLEDSPLVVASEVESLS